jgi:hypothetical protein
MLAGVDVETPVWHGAGTDGMLGCSTGDGGRWRGVGLTGGKPGEVCCGVPLVLAEPASKLFSSGAGTWMLGAGASGRASSFIGARAGRSVFPEGPVERSKGGVGVEARSASGFRCAPAQQQASEVRPTTVETKRAHLLSGLRCVPGMLALLDIGTMVPDDRSRGGACRGLRFATEGQTKRVRPEFKKQLTAHIAGDGSAETPCGNGGSCAFVRVIGHGKEASRGMAKQAGDTGPLLAVIVQAHVCLLDGEQSAVDEWSMTYAVEPRILMEESGKDPVAGETVGGLPHHCQAETIPEAAQIGPGMRIGIDQMAVSRRDHPRHEDGPACLLVARIEKLVGRAQGRCMLSGVDDRVPFVCVKRIGGADVQIEEGVVSTRAGLLFGSVCRLRLRCIRQRVFVFVCMRSVCRRSVCMAGRSGHPQRACCEGEARES